MTEAVSAPPVAHQQFRPGQWPQLTERDREIVRVLGHIGIPRHPAAILLAIMRYGKDQAVTSWWLEHITDARQPEISLALSWLMKDGTIRIERQAQIPTVRKGRPLKVFILNSTVGSYVRRKAEEHRHHAETRAAAAMAAFPEVY